MSSTEIEIARSQWADAHRRLEELRGEGTRYERLHRQVDAVSAELRRRIGESFTLAELVREYGRAERWSREAAAAAAEGPAQLRELALVEDAAFHRYARGAVDWAP